MQLRISAVLLALAVVAGGGLLPEAAAPWLGAHAQERRVPASPEEVKLSFAPVVRQAAPAVVNVYALQVARQSEFYSDPFFRRFFGDQGPLQQRVQQSLGSGVIVDPSGIVVTNVHVIANADEIKVALSDKRELPADVVLKDERSDLAVLKIRGDGPFATVPLGDSDGLEVGDLVLAIGNPFGVGQTVTSGIISGLARTHVSGAESQFYIQTDAAINPGNSGGALIDMAGRLVGINTAIYSRSGGSDGIGFAIPSNMVRVVAEAARSGGPVRRPWIGASMQALTPEIAGGLGLAGAHGALVSRIDQDGPAAAAGIRPGDLIVAIDGMEVDDPSALNYRLMTAGLGHKAKLAIQRGNERIEAAVQLIAAPETVARDEIDITGPSPFAGARVANLSPALAEEMGYSGDPQGVIVTDIARGSSADIVGLARGDVILSVNGVNVDSTRRLAQATAADARLWQIEIARNGQVIRSVLGG